MAAIQRITGEEEDHGITLTVLSTDDTNNFRSRGSSADWLLSVRYIICGRK